MVFGVNISNLNVTGRARDLFTALCLMALLCASACTTAPPLPDPWYDFDHVFLNDGVGGVAPWKKVDYEAVAKATRERDLQWAKNKAAQLAEDAREARAEARRMARQLKRERRAARADAASEKKVRKPQKKRRKSAKVARQASPRKKAPRAARIAPASPKASRKKATGAKHRPLVAAIGGDRRGGGALGDGSVSGELLAAAQRLLGISDDFHARPFLRHLLVVAAADIDVSAKARAYVGAVYRALDQAGKTFGVGARPAPGDLVFLHHVWDANGNGELDDPFTTAAVVEQVSAEGVVTVIGDVHGTVRRYKLDPARPEVRRDERSGRIVNSRLRVRTLADDSGTPALAGALFAGYARP